MSHSLFIYPLLKSEHTIRKLLVYMLRHFRIMMKQNITQESIKPLIDVHKDIMCDNSIKEYQKNLCYFSGTIDIFTYSILLTIIPRNNSYVRNITFHRYDVFKNSDKILTVSVQ